MERRHPVESIGSVIRNTLPNITVESISALPSRRLQRFFNIKVSDGRTLLLSLPPSPTLRLLRSERALHLSEVVVTRWILETVLESSSQVGERVHGSVTTCHHIGDQLWRDTGMPKRNILRYLPVLIAHSPSSAELGSPFNVFEVTRGVTIAESATPLMGFEKQIVDFQLGQFIRQLSSFTSPNGLFGSAIAVISPQSASSDVHTNQQFAMGFRGVKSWRQAFHSLLEGVLRDAEDMAVAISYEPIRGYFNRLGHCLDGVTVARLVLLDASDELNFLVSRYAKPTEQSEEESSPSPPNQQTKSRETRAFPTKSENSCYIEADNGTQSPIINVTGLRDWSNCIFGDPLMAEVFSRGPTTEFLQGLRQCQGANRDTPPPCPATNSRQEGDDDVLYNDTFIEDGEGAATRLLLYECYHATVGVVKSFYRPGPSSSDQEITARRRLATVLRRLEEVDEETVSKRARRPSANMEAWPVKRSKGDSRLPSRESPREHLKHEEEDQ
ncbi:hypothetical protein GGR53DRAFT_471524 [Hypoxylon sp. FL1150]|nr:hypothetical protein GGR53DRAFT_471524 [Hypoxylon sp. FL1150]